MKEVQYKSANGRLIFKIQAETTKKIFAEVAEIQSVFEADHACGVCHKTDIKFVVRESLDKKGNSNTYYELVCQSPGCGAKLAFGEYREGGGLFAKVWDSDSKQYYPNRGWKIWRRGGQDTGGYQSDADDAPPF